LPLSPHSQSQSPEEQTYQASTAILEELAPGQRLVETQLAQKLQVSRRRFGEAIGLLQHEPSKYHRPKWRAARCHHFKTDTDAVNVTAGLLWTLSVTGACQNTSRSYKLLELIIRRAEKLVNNSPH